MEEREGQEGRREKEKGELKMSSLRFPSPGSIPVASRNISDLPSMDMTHFLVLLHVCGVFSGLHVINLE